MPRDRFLAFCEQTVALDDDELVERYHLPLAEAETLVPALIVYRELLPETRPQTVLVPEASLRAGLLLDIAAPRRGARDRGLLAPGAGERRRRSARSTATTPPRQHVAALAMRLFDELRAEHGLPARDRLLLEVAALLHDIGIFVSLRGHHKHGQYILSVSEIFGLSRDDMAIVSNVARYHRRGMPNKSHLRVHGARLATRAWS